MPRLAALPTPTCANCAFYLKSSGVCRRSPPVPTWDGKRVTSKWSTVLAVDWCGEHAPTEESLNAR